MTTTTSFHSISFPNEWGVKQPIRRRTLTQLVRISFHSISFPNEWGVAYTPFGVYEYRMRMTRFHSISFPNEWGAEMRTKDIWLLGYLLVSIQLVSPTSGEPSYSSLCPYSDLHRVSIQLVSPTSGEFCQRYVPSNTLKFPFN
jgi:hypothetical protein